MTLVNRGFQMGCMMLALNGLAGRNYGIFDLPGEAFWIVHIVFTLIQINLQTQFFCLFFVTQRTKHRVIIPYSPENPLSKMYMYIYVHAPIQYLEHSAFLTAQKYQGKHMVPEYSSKVFLNY